LAARVAQPARGPRVRAPAPAPSARRGWCVTLTPFPTTQIVYLQVCRGLGQSSPGLWAMGTNFAITEFSEVRRRWTTRDMKPADAACSLSEEAALGAPPVELNPHLDLGSLPGSESTPRLPPSISNLCLMDPKPTPHEGVASSTASGASCRPSDGGVSLSAASATVGSSSPRANFLELRQREVRRIHLMST
jgi:hypothetical protein